MIWQLAFGLAQPIFQGGRLRAEVDAVTAREQQALAQYQKTVQVAFGEVREALVSQSRTREVFVAESDRVDALRETLRLARIRYDNGLTSQLEVIDAERSLLQAELNRVDALRAQRAAVADVVRALGGGWSGLPAVQASAAPKAVAAGAVMK
jgi:multidrug efflux system outer membrane protein